VSPDELGNNSSVDISRENEYTTTSFGAAVNDAEIG
jgi:hypothetical protein